MKAGNMFVLPKAGSKDHSTKGACTISKIFTVINKWMSTQAVFFKDFSQKSPRWSPEDLTQAVN